MNIIKAEISFNQSKLITVKKGDIEYVAMRPIVEGIGLNWSAQQQKIKNQKDKFNCIAINTVASDGKNRDVLCIPLKKLNGWLFSINPLNIKESLRDKLIKYQEECFTALHDYWVHGQAIRLSQAEKEAHEIMTFDKQTYKEASKGSLSMNKRKAAKKIVKQRIVAWQSKYQMSFDYGLEDIKAVSYAQ